MSNEIKKAPAQAAAAPAPEADAEDWQQDMLKKADEPADPKLAGMYRVKHGELFFSADKVVKTGRRVKLSAHEARHFLEIDAVERVA